MDVDVEMGVDVRENRNIKIKREYFLKFTEDMDEGEQYLNILNKIEKICKEEYKRAVDSYPYTKHDPSHCLKVEKNVYDLIPIDKYTKLSCRERFLLVASIWLHDIGMIPNLFYDRHNKQNFIKDIEDLDCISDIVSDLLDRIDEKGNNNIFLKNDKNIFNILFPISKFSMFTEDKDPSSILPSDINKTRTRHSQRSCIYVLNSCKIQELSKLYSKNDNSKCNFKDDIITISEICLLHPLKSYPILNKLNNSENWSRNGIKLPLIIAYLRLADALHIPDKGNINDFANFLARGPDQKAKFHWCKSRFTKSIDIRPKESLIKIVTKIPEDNVSNINENVWREKVLPMQKMIKEEILCEVDAIRDILARGEISYFSQISNDCKKDGEIANYEVPEYEKVLKYIDLVNNTSETPSSSLIVSNIVKTLEIILEQKVPNEVKIKHLEDFNINVVMGVMHDRSKHALLEPIKRKLDNVLNNKSNEEFLKELSSYINEWESDRNAIMEKIIKESMIIFKQKGPILLYGFSDTVLRCIKQYYIDNKYDKNLDLYICEVRPKTQYRYNNRLIFSDGLIHIKKLKEIKQCIDSESENKAINIYYIPDIAASNLFTLKDPENLTKKKNPNNFKVVLGTNAIDCNGNITHTLGVRMIADAAKMHDVPVYIIAELSKYINEDLKITEKNFRKNWFTTDIDFEPILENLYPLQFKCRNYNPREDLVPKEEITSYISEAGALKSEDFQSLERNPYKQHYFNNNI